MTIGPAPIMRMLSISVRLGILIHQRDKPLEEIMAVLRARARLRMVLDRKHRLSDHPQSFIRVVEQREMGGFDPLGQTLGVDDEAVVLASDLDLAGHEVLYRVIGAAMAPRHFAGGSTERQRQQLMTKADAEN